MQDRRVTVRELAEEVGISAGSVHSILTDDLALRSVREIRSEAANDGAEATPSGSRAGHAGLRK
jgi:predicted DsbA family dithiol-disulfide isomerase